MATKHRQYVIKIRRIFAESSATFLFDTSPGTKWGPC